MKKIKNELIEVGKAVFWWIMFITACEAFDFWWFDDGLRAANAFSGSGAYTERTFWVFGFFLPSLFIYALGKLGDLDKVTQRNS